MHPRNTVFLAVLFGTEFFIVMTFGLLFEQDTFYQLVTLSLVMTLIMGFFGILRMRNDPLYQYREAYDHEAHRFNEEV